MAEVTGPPVDPRFDPVFQRGYDPAVHAPVARRSVLRARPAVIPPMPVSEPDAPAEAPVAAVVDDAELEPARRNPWLLALLLTSIGLLVTAGAFLWSVGQRNLYSSGTPDAAEILLQQLAYMLPPALIVAGVLGIMLRVALGALKADRP